ncbi:MAG: 16S rRNA (adenine(1518)-N(6)/adenine(1519)-N(6))-dimethyltransferase RsmA [Clostridia bacterium]|nr:16S rRNA (adenine(1518)-N(6)/adenine(1519)-N(6))-dimethyltransferase RsmA [Clostridia bacterium]
MENLTKPSVVAAILKKHNFKISKRLGQNFLVDESFRQKIVAAGELQAGEVVVEIGPGLGVLTQALAEQNCQVIAIELDKHLLPILAENLGEYANVQVVHNDVLKVNLNELVLELTGKKCCKVMANLPYYITTPILLHLLENKFNIDLMVFMMQKEVAERITAQPGTKAYGSLSVVIQYFTEPQLVTKVPNTVFIPRPEVESAVVRFKNRKTPPVELVDEKMFFQIVRAAFGQRRKTLANALRGSRLGLDKESVTDLLNQAGIDGNRRGETLSLDEFALLSNTVSRY